MIIKQRIRSIALPIIWKINPGYFSRRFTYYGQVFSIGVYYGDSPLSIHDGGATQNPVFTAADITDIPAAFVADPFVLFDNQRWYLFFEVYNRLKRRGEIGLAVSEDHKRWNYRKIVLKSATHLSYPHIFKYENRYFMIPENMHEGVNLYEARAFPDGWTFKKKLIDREGFVDSTVFQYDGLWWMFTSQDGPTADAQSLHLFYADAPDGHWTEHPRSPLKSGRENLTRCAGRVIDDNGRLIRFAQTGFPAYGKDVRAFDILRLDKREYLERPARPDAVVCGGDGKWNRGGMHHIDAQRLADGRWMAMVDGWYENSRPDARAGAEKVDADNLR